MIASTFSFTYIETAAIFIVNGFVVKLAVLLIIIYCLKIILDNFNRLKVKMNLFFSTDSLLKESGGQSQALFELSDELNKGKIFHTLFLLQKIKALIK